MGTGFALGTLVCVTTGAILQKGIDQPPLTLLLYNLIRSGNLVNVTSLFYLLPPTTAALDFLLLGNSLPTLTAIGMATILARLLLVFRASVRGPARVAEGSQ
jgi:drug/metabolite transporter (DMT)-like permease